MFFQSFPWDETSPTLIPFYLQVNLWYHVSVYTKAFSFSTPYMCAEVCWCFPVLQFQRPFPSILWIWSYDPLFYPLPHDASNSTSISGIHLNSFELVFLGLSQFLSGRTKAATTELTPWDKGCTELYLGLVTFTPISSSQWFLTSEICFLSY